MKNFIKLVVPGYAVSFYHKNYDILRNARMKWQYWILCDTGSKDMFSVENLSLLSKI